MNLQSLCIHNEAAARSSGVSGVDTLHTKNGRNGRFANTESTCIPAYHSPFSDHRKNRLPLVPLNSKTPLVLPDNTPVPSVQQATSSSFGQQVTLGTSSRRSPGDEQQPKKKR